MSIIVIHGPPGSGKTLNARAFADFFGIETIVDDGKCSHQPFPQRKAIVLTTRSPDEVRRWRANSLRGPRSAEAVAFVPIVTALRRIGAPMPKPALSLAEHTTLTFLSEGGPVATQHIAGLCRHRQTATARDMMKRLEKRGFARGVSAPGKTRICWWQITDAGRMAVQA